MQGKISFYKEFGPGRGWGYLESQSKTYHFVARDVTSGLKRLRVGADVEFELAPVSEDVIPQAESIMILPLEASDV